MVHAQRHSAGQAPTRILIADDHPLFREALRYVVERVFAKNHIVEAKGYGAALALTHEGAFDIVFVDLMMPGGSESLTELANLRAQIPSTPIVVISSREDWPMIRRVLALGVSAYIPKSAPRAEMESAIRSVLAGDVYAPFDSLRESPVAPVQSSRGEPLTPRQAAVLEHLARGSSNRQIAHDLCIEEITVKAHISAILRKLHVKNRLEAVVATRAYAERMGED